MISTNELRAFDEFRDIPEENLQWLVDQLEERVLPKGSSPFDADDPADHMMIMLEGAIRIHTLDRGQWRAFGTSGPGDITGLLPFSRMTHFTGRGEAIKDSRIALLHKEHFREMLYRMPELGQPLVGRMSDRVRTSTRSGQEREKMQALGKLSAGLAHELNNPAAAVRRASEALRARLDQLPGLVACLARHGLEVSRLKPAEHLCHLHHGAKALSPVQMGEREDELLDWLEDHGVADAWELAPNLAEAGKTAEQLDSAINGVPAEAVTDIVRWIEANVASESLLKEIGGAAERISALVGSIKAYSHMDRDPNMQRVNLRDGIESTLTMLGHKLRAKSVKHSIDWPDDIPMVPVLPGEANQVWTNLVDNAIDAMDDGGHLTIRARKESEAVAIEVEDSGSGIPEDVVPRIFEPFYTTKEIGEGTGMGLDIVHRIVTEQHSGDIFVESEPGRTVFTVRLPLATVTEQQIPD